MSGEGRAGLRLTSDVLIFTSRQSALKLLLIRRGEAPEAGRWSLPSGEIGVEETAEEAAVRALKEQTGLTDVYLEQLYTFSDLSRWPGGRAVAVGYLAFVPLSRIQALPTGEDMALFEVRRDGRQGCLLVGEGTDGPVLSPSQLAFDHGHMVRTALRRMAGKLEYTDIGFEFLEDKGRFTLSELRDIYSAVSGREYDLANFRRFIKNRYEGPGRIEPTGEKARRRGTPAMIYRMKEEAPWSGY